ncbi:MAG: hypothetical protein U9N46_14270 [Euryarchaeota archaeon]|nr:hypothetical protein [Euryarchaeota archaeon]
MSRRRTNVILAIAVIMVILPACAQEIPTPHGIEGTVYMSDGVTQVPVGTSFSVNDTTSGDHIAGTTGAGPFSGAYSVSIDGSDGDTVVVTAWNVTHHGITTVTLVGSMTEIDVLLDTPFTDTTPPASVSNLDETDRGTTWIQWDWTNPSDSDFSHTRVYIDGVFKAEVYAPGDSYNAASLSPDTTYMIGTRTVDDSGNTNTEWVKDAATTLSSSAPPTTTSSSATGAPKYRYRTNEDVYAAGSGFTPGTSVDIYVVLDQDWNDGDQIPADVTGAVETVPVNDGDVGPVLVWHAPLTPGRYDIVIDANQNGFYDTATDGLDSGSPGFVVIADAPPTPPVPVPVLTPPGIIALIGLLCVAGMSRIRRRFN